VNVHRSFLVALAMFVGLPLLAAAPDSSLLAKPSVIVYPFVPTGASVDREAGSRLATILAQQMANTGKVKVIPPPPGTDRANYLKAALANDADYYVTGYITPLGDAVAVVEQVVSTTTGIVVFSQTAQLHTYSDAANQGSDLGVLIAGHANRNLIAIGTAPPQATPAPAASQGPQADIGKLLKGRKKAASTPTPRATPGAAASAPAAALTNVTPPPGAAPSSTTTVARANPSTPAPAPPKTVAAAPVTAAAAWGVVPIEGTADSALREQATQRIMTRFSGERTATVRAACDKAIHSILSGTLTVRPSTDGGTSATLDLTATDCSGKRFFHQTSTSSATGATAQQVSVERAVDAAINDYLNPPKRRR
jgi:TolB-like protein